MNTSPRARSSGCHLARDSKMGKTVCQPSRPSTWLLGSHCQWFSRPEGPAMLGLWRPGSSCEGCPQVWGNATPARLVAQGGRHTNRSQQSCELLANQGREGEYLGQVPVPELKEDKHLQHISSEGKSGHSAASPEVDGRLRSCCP